MWQDEKRLEETKATHNLLLSAATPCGVSHSTGLPFKPFRRGDGVREGRGDGGGLVIRGGGGGGRLVPTLSPDDEGEVRRRSWVAYTSTDLILSDSEGVVGRRTSTASCSNLERRLLTAWMDPPSTSIICSVAQEPIQSESDGALGTSRQSKNKS